MTDKNSPFRGLGGDISPVEAIALQHELRQQINIRPLEKEVKIIGGADISFNKYTDVVYAGIVLLTYPDLKIISKTSVKTTTSFPYISGLLAFREIPALLEVWDKLNVKPDVMILDGQGIAHERRMGIATHFGLVTDTPALGCAKSRLAGRYSEPDNRTLAESPMYDGNEQIGVALRTKINCNPVYISPGHRISMEQSVTLIKNCVRGYRIPEPTRQAHLFVNQVRLADGGSGIQTTMF